MNSLFNTLAGVLLSIIFLFVFFFPFRQMLVFWVCKIKGLKYVAYSSQYTDAWWKVISCKRKNYVLQLELQKEGGYRCAYYNIEFVRATESELAVLTSQFVSKGIYLHFAKKGEMLLHEIVCNGKSVNGDDEVVQQHHMYREQLRIN